jgi:hypothetical protein
MTSSGLEEGTLMIQHDIALCESIFCYILSDYVQRLHVCRWIKYTKSQVTKESHVLNHYNVGLLHQLKI